MRSIRPDMRLVALLRRVLLAVCVLLAAAVPAFAEPGLWVAYGNTATVYLFGTLHALLPGAVWRSAALEVALQDAQDVWLEVADPSDQLALVPLILQLGRDSAHPLSGKLTRQQLDRLDVALRQVGVADGEAKVDAFRPWLVATMLMMAPLRAAGLDFKSGVDLALRADAIAAGKQVHGLETLEQQTHLFADLSPDAELAFLVDTLDSLDQGGDLLRKTFDAWIAGDVDTLAQLDAKDTPPDLLRTMIRNRNAVWADRIAAMLHGSGTTLVAVGAGHIGGDSGLLRLLAARGFAIERIQ